MTPQDFQAYLALQQQIIELLSRMALALEQMIPTGAAPNYQFAIKDFASFNWASIGAVVIASDSSGATAVSWKHHTYLRRSPTNNFKAAIWFSRCTGKDERGNNVYEKLVTFKAIRDAEPLNDRVTSVQR
ncbi:MAG: single-stranded DNA-binding protein [Chroococcus sp. CMT-3BRIN-NPC107]|jgi:phospholipase C|nr:single-stranded DNA-binding protein [Chroococcus sp. CMT-3BRIN-NPC107]